MNFPPFSDVISKSASKSFQLPLAAIVKALCDAASMGPDVLSSLMVKVALTAEAVAQTYGLAIFTQSGDKRPTLKWTEGLNQEELDQAEERVFSILALSKGVHEVKAGEKEICFLLARTTAQHEGSAIYGRCVRPLTAQQAKELKIISDVSHLAHAHALLRQEPRSESPKQKRASTTSSPVSKGATLPGMIFTSRAMTDVARAVERVKNSDSTVLITGESGTGKELIARSIHRLSRRSHARFTPFNCTAAPADLIESLLFGHRKGAFTGAYKDTEGLIRATEGGTLFLDEIGDLPLHLQPKLLRFLQDGEIYVLGESAPRQVNMRVVAATNKDLARAIREGSFREDLYYRIAGLRLHVPPLRERPEDIAALISHFISHYSRRNDRAIAGITAETIHALQAYTWPGNIRELAGEIERLVLYTDEGEYINVNQLSSHIRPAKKDSSSTTDTPADLESIIEDFERRLILDALQRNDNNVARTAIELGLSSRQTLYKKLKRLSINVKE